jgi:hypothetical protein
VTGHAGRFRVSRSLRAGVFYKLVVSAPGFAEAAVRRSRPGQHPTCAIQCGSNSCEAQAARAGRLRDHAPPIEGVSVTYVTNYPGGDDSAEAPRSTQWFASPSTSGCIVKRTSTNGSASSMLEESRISRR